jgi:hypothetical protein
MAELAAVPAPVGGAEHPYAPRTQGAKIFSEELYEAAVEAYII